MRKGLAFMYTVKMLIELTPLLDGERWYPEDAVRFCDDINEGGYGYRVIECAVDSEDDTELVASIEKDFESLEIEGYDEDADEYYVDHVDHGYLESDLNDVIDDAYFDFGTLSIAGFEIAEW